MNGDPTTIDGAVVLHLLSPGHRNDLLTVHDHDPNAGSVHDCPCPNCRDMAAHIDANGVRS